eukprot:NODE_613_length_5985_cov_0.176351.p1 type:complete len:917 gc:universal NODE_613_length_5985_cov_0.176351:3469-719(-)
MSHYALEIQSCNNNLKFISCLAIHKYVVCGGYDGTIHVLTVQTKHSPTTNENDPMQLNSNVLQYSTLLSYQAHKVMILGIDTQNNTVVSTALDGTIYCYQIDTNQIYQIQLQRPVKSVQLYQSNTSSFVSRNIQPQFLYTFENKLIYNTSTLLNNNKNIIYLEENEPIDNLFVHSKYILTCNSNEIHLYEEKHLLLHLDKRFDFIAHAYFTDSCLIIGWSNYLCMYSLKPLKLLFETTLPFTICGVGLLNQKILLLGYPTRTTGEAETTTITKMFDFDASTSTNDTVRKHQSEFTNDYPILALFDTNTLIINDTFALSIPDYKSIRPLEYKFASNSELFAISSPQIMLLGHPTTLSDQCKMLVKDNLILEAMELLKNQSQVEYRNPTFKVPGYEIEQIPVYKSVGYPVLLHDVGILLINQYLNQNDLLNACLLFNSVLTTAEYNHYYNKYKNNSLLFASVMPISNELQQLYNIVIKDMITIGCYSELNSFIHYLPPNSFSLTMCIDLLNAQENKDSKSKQCLEYLYLINKQFDLLCCVYLDLKNYKAFFSLLSEHPYLLPFIVKNNQVLDYFECLSDIANNPKEYKHLLDKLLLYATTAQLPRSMNITIENVGYYLLVKLNLITTVVPKLKSTKYLHTLLSFIFKLDVKLYPEYHELLLIELMDHPNELMHFLRNTNNYSIQLAIEKCKEHKHTNECLYLYGRMGNSKDAITIIVEHNKDYKLAVEYAEDLQDAEIWELLINFAVKYPLIWQYILKSSLVNSKANETIKHIPNNAKIKGLKQLMMDIMNNNNIEQGLTFGCSEIMINDCLKIFKEYSNKSFSGTWIIGQGEYLVFGCGHCYHVSDLEIEEVVNAPKTQRKRTASVSSASSNASSFRKFKKNTQQLKIIMESNKQLTQVPQHVECPICMKSASIISK